MKDEGMCVRAILVVYPYCSSPCAHCAIINRTPSYIKVVVYHYKKRKGGLSDIPTARLNPGKPLVKSLTILR